MHDPLAVLVIAERFQGSGSKKGFSSANMAATCRLAVPWMLRSRRGGGCARNYREDGCLAASPVPVNFQGWAAHSPSAYLTLKTEPER
jgi:hypothetical protein